MVSRSLGGLAGGCEGVVEQSAVVCAILQQHDDRQ
jgi:hypothetical protein